MRLKRFLVFAYDQYYPGGGWSDLRSQHDLLAERDQRIAELEAEIQRLKPFEGVVKAMDIVQDI